MDLTMVPILGIVVGVPGFVAFIALVMGHARKMKELKIRELELEIGGELGPVVEALSDDLNDTRARMAELQERLDFAERLLAAGGASEHDGNG